MAAAITQTRPALVIAIDIESSGGNMVTNPTFAVGIVSFLVVDRDVKLVSKDRIVLNKFPELPSDDRGSLFDKETNKIRGATSAIKTYGSFEPRCWEEFWSKNIDVLNKLNATTDEIHETPLPRRHFRTVRSDYVGMSVRQTIDRYVVDILKANPATDIRIVSDNPAFDIGRIDYQINADSIRLIQAANETRGTQTLNYILKSDAKDATRVYNGIESTDNLYDLKRAGKIVFEDVPCDVEHDHMPENDAHTIGWKYCNIMLQLDMFK